MSAVQDVSVRPGILTSVRARQRGLVQFIKFGLIGVSGLFVNTAVLALWAGGLGFHYLLGVVVATQVSSSWNFVLTDNWVFSEGGSIRWSKWSRFLQFAAMNNLALVLRGPIVWLLTEEAGVHYILSNIASLVVFMVGRFAFSTKYIWGGQSTAGIEDESSFGTDFRPLTPVNPAPGPYGHLTSGRWLTTSPTPVDLAAQAVTVGTDLAPLASIVDSAILGPEGMLVSLAKHPGEPSADVLLFNGPLPHLEPGQVMGLRVLDARLEVAALDQPMEVPDRVLEALAQEVESEPVSVADVVSNAMASVGSAWPDVLPPIEGVLLQAGLSCSGTRVGPAGYPWRDVAWPVEVTAREALFASTEIDTRPVPAPALVQEDQEDQEVSRVAPKTRTRDWKRILQVVALVGIPSLVLRLVFLDSLGFNSDEAVYAGQAASISGDDDLLRYFPIFRAHPLFFHSSLSVVYKAFGISPLIGRLVAVFFGMLGVAATYLLGSVLYSRRTGVIAALILGVMPYHVMVSRQVLLDGPMVLFSTLTVYFLAKFALEGRSGWLYSSAAMFGMTFLTNERSIVLLGSAYLFFAMSPTVKIRFRQMVTSMVIVVAMMVPYPLSVFFSGKTTTGSQFLAWQLFRRANHGWTFYPIEVSKAVGYFTLIAVALAVWRLWPNRSWKEVLLAAWCGVPVLFFEIWPVKGFQYLLAIAPILAILAARGIDLIPRVVIFRDRNWNGMIVRFLAVALLVVPLVSDSWSRATPAGAGEAFLAGSGGVPGGREAGEWVGANVPEGAELLAIGPSMANIIQWYGDRKTYGLSVSPNPLHRNPVYEPIRNPDLLLRNGDLHYLIWDSFSAGRSEFFSNKLQVFAERYNGRIVHQEFIQVSLPNGETIEKPVIIIYEVRP